MKKFFILYCAPVEEMQKLMAATSEAERNASMQDWQKWMESHKSDIVDMGAPVGQNKRVTQSGVTSAHNEVGGYSIIQAESYDAASTLLKDNPHLMIPGAYIDLL